MQSLFYVLAAKINAQDAGIPALAADNALNGLLNIVYTVAGMIAVITIIISGIIYSISQGDATKITRAKNGILYSVVGLIIIISAFVITNFVIGRF